MGLDKFEKRLAVYEEKVSKHLKEERQKVIKSALGLLLPLLMFLAIIAWITRSYWLSLLK